MLCCSESFFCKAAGPDGILSHILKARTAQLSQVCASIFHLSLSLCTVPLCFKNTAIVHMPKKMTVNCQNDYQPIALS